MNSEEQIYQQIESYLNGNLKGEELSTFENNLLINPELKRKVELSRIANELIIENRLLDIKNILNQTHQDSGKNNWGHKTIFISAGLLIAGSLFFLYTQKDLSTVKKTKVDNETSSVLPSNTLSVEKKNQEEIYTKNISSTGKTTSSNVSVGKNDSIIQASSIVANNKNAELIPVKTDETTDKYSNTNTNTSISLTDLCKNISLHANVSAKASCEEEGTGSIVVSDINGGSAPYRYQIKDEEGHKLNSGFALKSGLYSVSLIDKNGCSNEIKNIAIKEKSCPKDYSFNPFVGESWSIPVSENFGNLIIYDHSGRIYYQKELNSSSEESWNGYSDNGELQIGYFIFAISYKSGKVIKGSVTIVR